ncbi:helix-turn-helix domain-containing protein [Limosilactobacillus reuteri]|uniref:DNA-binding protein n=1 Tax=Limosilactobacillus reuteri TaxID=1598 RepID=A0AB36HZB2_LIMRT|nr:helix-turn-helix domain-containing protein [Limosilactobacillus reuteri]MCC4368515.1 helix-turn-helix domain-containing protein [Limosilactobacillus reuteri]MCC4371235.1 helix-turn-helix domain-containing protein [Limosilactobacillus reuteri]MRH46407.1 DNA-binding protein [Limosilactobacillus reuteri]OJI10066.1 DNA-binding protein [Limosilactobacillus reuteri]
MPGYFNYKQAMAYMNIKSKTTFGKYLANGLPTIKVGNSKRIAKSDIDKFMADHRVVATQDK